MGTFRAVFAALVLGGFGTGSAATIHVDAEGLGGTCSDAGSRDRSVASNPSTPVCTLERANALALDGDVIRIRRGTYYPPARVNFYQDDLTIRAAAGETVVVDFSRAAAYSKGITLVGDRETLEEVEITNSWEECLVTYGSGLRVLRNRVHHCGFRLDADGRYQGCLQSSAPDILLEGNRIYDCASHVLYMTGDGITLRNNVFFGADPPPNPPNWPDGRQSVVIKIGTDNASASNVTIVHNVIGESKNRSGIYLTAPGASIDTAVVANNLIYGNRGVYGWAIYVDNQNTSFPGPVTIRNNAFAANEAGNLVSFESDPPSSAFDVGGNLTFDSLDALALRDAAARDFYPGEASPLIDAGLPGLATADLFGTARPFGAGADIGPYEFNPGVSPPPALPGGTPGPGGPGAGTDGGGCAAGGGLPGFWLLGAGLLVLLRRPAPVRPR